MGMDDEGNDDLTCKPFRPPVRPDPTALDEGPGGGDGLETGKAVTISGLVSAAGQQLNGRRGVLGPFDASCGRWQVKLLDGAGTKALRPDNLVLDLTCTPCKPPGTPGLTAPLDDEAPGAMPEGDDEAPGAMPEGARWARDDSGVVWCESAEGLRQAVADGNEGVEIGGADAGPLLEAVAEVAGSLEFLSLTGCGLDAAALGRLAAALAPTQIKGVGVSNNPGVEARAWAAFWAALPASVAKWDFGDNGLGDACLEGLASAVGRGAARELLVDGNGFCDVAPLLALVRGSQSLVELDLGDNKLADAQVRALAEVLPGSAVETLVVGRNPGITDTGAVALVYALPKTKVATLHLDSTQIGDATLDAMADVLADTQLVELHIDETKVTDQGVLHLCKALSRSRIRFLDAGDNNLSDETARAVEAALGADTSVT